MRTMSPDPFELPRPEVSCRITKNHLVLSSLARNRLVDWNVTRVGDGLQHWQVSVPGCWPTLLADPGKRCGRAKASILSEGKNGAKRVCGGKFFCGWSVVPR
jgi:hypothetical protein